MSGNLLCVDVGNTVSKAAVFENGERVAYCSGPELDVRLLAEWQRRFSLEHAVFSAVSDDIRLPMDAMRSLFTLHFPNRMPVPIKSAYRTPETLGTDRLACMVAASVLFPATDVLVLQCGTCLTSDLLTAGAVYMGGGISPGLGMRFHALKEHTARLPLVRLHPDAPLYGQSTEASIQSGVFQGYLAELEGLILKYMAVYKDVKVILTGGDAPVVKDKLKMAIFAFPDMVLYGLMEMLKYELEKQ